MNKREHWQNSVSQPAGPVCRLGCHYCRIKKLNIFTESCGRGNLISLLWTRTVSLGSCVSPAAVFSLPFRTDCRSTVSCARLLRPSKTHTEAGTRRTRLLHYILSKYTLYTNNTIGGPRPMTMEAAPERRKRMNMTHTHIYIRTCRPSLKHIFFFWQQLHSNKKLKINNGVSRGGNKKKRKSISSNWIRERHRASVGFSSYLLFIKASTPILDIRIRVGHSIIFFSLFFYPKDFLRGNFFLFVWL